MPKRYSPGEEIANTSTHAVGILLGVVVGIAFIVTSLKGGDAWTGWSIGLYLFGMLSSYICSTAYHALPQGKAKQTLRKFDHAAIYWHIAGSYSPITLLAIMQKYDVWGIGLFCFIWGAAIVGSVFSFFNRDSHSHLETTLQEALYAHRFPRLCLAGLRLPYHRSMGCPHPVPFIKIGKI